MIQPARPTMAADRPSQTSVLRRTKDSSIDQEFVSRVLTCDLTKPFWVSVLLDHAIDDHMFTSLLKNIANNHTFYPGGYREPTEQNPLTRPDLMGLIPIVCQGRGISEINQVAYLLNRAEQDLRQVLDQKDSTTTMVALNNIRKLYSRYRELRGARRMSILKSDFVPRARMSLNDAKVTSAAAHQDRLPQIQRLFAFS